MYRVRYCLLHQVVLVLLTSNSKYKHRGDFLEKKGDPFFLAMNLKVKRSKNTKSGKAEKKEKNYSSFRIHCMQNLYL